MNPLANAPAKGLDGFDPRAPYAEAWEEFDRLKDTASDGPFMTEYTALALGVLVAVVADFYKATHFELISAAITGLIVAMIAARVKRRRSKFEHWPCPRCHSEWPGKKLEKDPRCTVCGLKLHQLMP